MESPITPAQFGSLLPSLCSVITATGNGKGWSASNPTFGHCAVASLVAQNLFGGELLRISLEGTPFAESRSHYFNRLSDGTIVDFTAKQFGDWTSKGIPAELRTRDYVIGGADTRARYVELAWQLMRKLYFRNPLVSNYKYEQCIRQALLSPCQKMGFGALTADPETGFPFITHRGNNHSVPGLESMCQPTCIRFGISSRTESMLGACGHAEEWAIWDMTRGTAPYDLYVAGVYGNVVPYIKSVPEHTCLRCSVTIAYAGQFSGLRCVWVPVVDRWEPLTPAQCLATAKAYALKEKKV